MIAILFVIMQFATVFGVHDLSKKYDLKENNMILKREGIPCESKITKEKLKPETGSFFKRAVTKLFQLLKRPDLSVLFYTSFISGLTILSFETLLSLLATNTLRWSMVYVSYAFILAGIVYLILTLALFCCSNLLSDFNMVIVGYTMEFLGLVCLLVFNYCPDAFRVILFSMLVIVYSCAWVVLRTPLHLKRLQYELFI